jgi:hypothetical protein
MSDHFVGPAVLAGDLHAAHVHMCSLYSTAWPSRTKAPLKSITHMSVDDSLVSTLLGYVNTDDLTLGDSSAGGDRTRLSMRFIELKQH